MSEKFELREDISASPLYNADIAPTAIERRTWNAWHIAALWIGMSVCIPTYMLGAGLMKAGMLWWQAVLTITLGNLIVFVPMALNAHAGTKYGIPFPVFLRAPFGTAGSNVPALMRAAVACGWFGIQTWIGGKACYLLAAVLVPGLTKAEALPFLGINGWQLLFFLFFWAINVFFIVKGTESIKWLETWSAPILIAVGLGLLVWGISAGGGLGRILRHSENFTRPTVVAVRSENQINVTLSPVMIDGKTRAREARIIQGVGESARTFKLEGDLDGMGWRLDAPPNEVSVEFEAAGVKPWTVPAKVTAAPSGGGFWVIFFPLLTGMVGYWATLALNIPDFTRFAKSQRDQVAGQLLGLPTTMGLYAFIGIATTCAALVVFPDILVTEQAPWDPVELLKRFENPALVIASMFFLVVATLTTNIAANVVSPANDFSNLAPKLISWKTGGLITAVIGVIMMPWLLVENPKTYIFSWLGGYGALLGPIAGVMIADYYVVRRTRLQLADLYRSDGVYGRFNWGTIVILFLAILPNVPGFLMSVHAADPRPFWQSLFDYTWFLGFAIAFILHSAYGLTWKRTATSSTASG